MKWTDVRADLGDFWQEFRQVKSGVFSLILLGVFLLVILGEPYLIPFSETGTRWRDITYWENNPRNAPPAWLNWFSPRKRAVSQELAAATLDEVTAGKMTVIRAEFAYPYEADIPPGDLLFLGRVSGAPLIVLSLERPDGETIQLLKKPISKSGEHALRISIENDGRASAYAFGARYAAAEDRISKDLLSPTTLLFAHAGPGMFRSPQPLRGDYRLRAEILLPTADDRISDPTLIIQGSVSGLLGTDASRRDIWSGVVSGVKWALLIGLLTAVVAVSVGVVYGVMSAYFGGWRDSLMQRVFEVFVSIPLLPLLIVMSAIFKPSIWTLIFMMSAFFWVGPVKTVRSMGLQIKEETYIEASRAFGASSGRIIFRHIVPLLVPYAFASMALYVPSAIVYESTISLLGLGDSTIVTWGQILHDALNGGAVLNGQWWWVIPPGLAIALMGMTFAFLGFAMDTILHPKLRTR